MSERKTIRITDPSKKSRTVSIWTSYGWVLKDTTDVFKEETRVSPAYHHVELDFERDQSIPNYAELVALEKKYLSTCTYAEAVEVEKLSKAAEQGDADAQYKLGLIYTDGQGVLNNPKKGQELIWKAAEQGHVKAKDYLAKVELEAKKKKLEARKDTLDEIKFILIGTVIGGIVGAIAGIGADIGADIFSDIVFAMILGLWAGLGIGGNIVFIPELFEAGGCLFGLLFAFFGLVAFAIVGPIWPLIRILMKISELMKI